MPPPVAPQLKDHTVDVFLNRKGEDFAFDDGGSQPVLLELIEVARLRPPGSAPVAGVRAEPFAPIFRSLENRVLRSEQPKIVEPGFEPCEVFLPRIMPPPRRPADAVYYQAILA